MSCSGRLQGRSVRSAFTVLVVFAASTIVTSLVVVGRQPLIGLTGQLIPSGTALPLVIASWATAAAPLLGFTALAVLLSVLSRNPAIGIVGPVVIALVMQLVRASVASTRSGTCS